MTDEEFAPTYGAWSPRERQTFSALRTRYKELRAEVGSAVYITRQMLAQAAGSNSIGTASKFMKFIEALEDDQPQRNRRAEAPRHTDSSEPAPPAIQAAFDGVYKALEAACRAVLDLRAKEGLELAEHYQRLQREYLAGADAREQALAERIADLEAASSGAGEESWDQAAVAEELRAALQAAISDRDAAQAKAEQAIRAHEIDSGRLAAADAHGETLMAGLAMRSAEVSRLVEEVERLKADAASGVELRTENAVLRDRVTSLSEEVRRLETLMGMLATRPLTEVPTFDREAGAEA